MTPNGADEDDDNENDDDEGVLLKYGSCTVLVKPNVLLGSDQFNIQKNEKQTPSLWLSTVGSTLSFNSPCWFISSSALNCGFLCPSSAPHVL